MNVKLRNIVLYSITLLMLLITVVYAFGMMAILNEEMEHLTTKASSGVDWFGYYFGVAWLIIGSIVCLASTTVTHINLKYFLLSDIKTKTKTFVNGFFLTTSLCAYVCIILLCF